MQSNRVRAVRDRMNEEDRRRHDKAWNDPPLFSYDQLNKQPSQGVPINRRYKHPAPEPNQMYGYQPGQPNATAPNMMYGGAAAAQHSAPMYGGMYQNNPNVPVQQMPPQHQQQPPNSNMSSYAPSYAQGQPNGAPFHPGYDYAMQNPGAYSNAGNPPPPSAYNHTPAYSMQPTFSPNAPPNPAAYGTGNPMAAAGAPYSPDQSSAQNYNTPGYQPYPGNYYAQ
jgi:hypothetical protein